MGGRAGQLLRPAGPARRCGPHPLGQRQLRATERPQPPLRLRPLDRRPARPQGQLAAAQHPVRRTAPRGPLALARRQGRRAQRPPVPAGAPRPGSLAACDLAAGAARRHRVRSAARRGPPQRRAAGHDAGRRPPRRLGTRHPRRHRPLGPAHVPLLRPAARRRHAALRGSRGAHPPRRPTERGLPRLHPHARPLQPPLPHRAARRQPAPRALALGSQGRPRRPARPRGRPDRRRHRGLPPGRGLRQDAHRAQHRRRAGQHRRVAPRPRTGPLLLQRPRLPHPRRAARTRRRDAGRAALAHPPGRPGPRAGLGGAVDAHRRAGGCGSPLPARRRQLGLHPHPPRRAPRRQGPARGVHRRGPRHQQPGREAAPGRRTGRTPEDRRQRRGRGRVEPRPQGRTRQLERADVQDHRPTDVPGRADARGVDQRDRPPRRPRASAFDARLDQPRRAVGGARVPYRAA